MTKIKAIRVMLVDDSEVVRMGLRTLLEGTEDIQIVAEAASVAEALAVFQKAEPTVVLLDLRLSDGSGLVACRAILNASRARVLVLTSVADDALVGEAIRAGAHGYLLKEIDAEGLVRAIHELAAGKSILDPKVTARVLQMAKSGGTADELATLSYQERRVLTLISEGNTNKEVGVEMGLSEKTVKNYLSNVFEKLKVSRRTEAVAIYLKNN